MQSTYTTSPSIGYGRNAACDHKAIGAFQKERKRFRAQAGNASASPQASRWLLSVGETSAIRFHQHAAIAAIRELCRRPVRLGGDFNAEGHASCVDFPKTRRRGECVLPSHL